MDASFLLDIIRYEVYYIREDYWTPKMLEVFMNEVIMQDFITIKEAAEKWNITARRIQVLCTEGRIKGASKFGRDWAIPINATRPEDKRIKSGKYINQRKSKSEKYTDDGGRL